MSSMPVTFVHPAVTMLVLASLLAACGHEPVRQLPGNGKRATQSHPFPDSPRRSSAEQAAIVAVRQVGVPYRYGGSTTAGFDCSGLVQFAYASAGKSIPRTTAAQWRQLSPVAGNDLRVGDLLFFRIDGRISHVALRVPLITSHGRAVGLLHAWQGGYAKTVSGYGKRV